MRKFWKRKQWAYRKTFNLDDEAVKIVIADLRVFCHATKKANSNDPQDVLEAEFKRQVFMRIMDFIKVDYSNFYNYEEEIE